MFFLGIVLVTVPLSRRGTGVVDEEPDRQWGFTGLAFYGMDDDIDPAAVEEEHQLKDHNEEEDALALLGGSAAINIDDAPLFLVPVVRQPQAP